MYQPGTKEWDENYSRFVEERKKAESEPYIVLTPEWASQFEKTVQRDERYKKVAKTWEGSVTLVFKGDPEAGLDDDLFILMDLWHGECRSASLITDEGEKTPEFRITASLDRWRRVIEKKLDPIQGMITRQMNLKGNLMKIMKAPKAALELVNCCTRVPTEFPE